MRSNYRGVRGAFLARSLGGVTLLALFLSGCELDTVKKPRPSPSPSMSPSSDPTPSPSPCVNPSPTPSPTPLKPSPAPSPNVSPSPEPTSLYKSYVAPSGSDTNSGSISSPWKTIQRAANMAKPGTTIYIRGGTYRESVKVNVSGSASVGPIIFQNYPNENVIIDGTGLTPSTSGQ